MPAPQCYALFWGSFAAVLASGALRAAALVLALIPTAVMLLTLLGAVAGKVQPFVPATRVAI